MRRAFSLSRTCTPLRGLLRPGQCKGTTAPTTTTASAAGFAASATSPRALEGVVVVQGASRGIGLEMCRQVLEQRTSSHVVGTCRNPGEAEQLQALAAAHPGRLDILRVDVLDVPSMEAAAEEVKERHGRIDALINSAGLLHIPGKMMPETALARVNEEAMLLAYRTNAMGPTLMTKAFWDLIQQGAVAAAGEGRQPPVVANISARVGSIGDNGLGGWHSYRASKSALNQLTTNVAIEMARKKHPAISLLLHPGTTATDLSGPFQKNVPKGKLFPVQFTANSLLGIVDGAVAADSGKFVAWDGQEIPW